MIVLHQVACLHFHLGSDRIAVAFGANQFQLQPASTISTRILKQLRAIVDIR